MECSGTSDKSHCTCTYTACDKRGNCCQCVAYHHGKDEIPGCFFTTAGERTHNRSIKHFILDRSS
jgi:hypothetical protein